MRILLVGRGGLDRPVARDWSYIPWDGGVYLVTFTAGRC
jgi:hypothetical protein